MSIKRKLQYIKRVVSGLIKNGTMKSRATLNMEESISTDIPKVFDKAIFNFTIDFELVWGNGNLGGCDHDYHRRVHAAKTQKENFYPFTDLLKSTDVKITWAALGKLLDPSSIPPRDAQFSPEWTTNYYDQTYTSLENSLWDGREYIDYILEDLRGHELISHGHSHIDFSDPATRLEVAKWDIEHGIQALRAKGPQVNGFVYPCNQHGYQNLLVQNGIEIIRGSDHSWKTQGPIIHTPLGFWISPAFMNAKEVISVIKKAIDQKAFIHPWMHLIECDLTQNDLDNFYRPIFEFVKERQSRGELEILSFDEINQRIRSLM